MICETPFKCLAVCRWARWSGRRRGMDT